MMAGSSTVGEALRIALKQEGRMSLRELGRRSGVSAAQLSRLVAGDVARPSPRTLVALSRALQRNPTPLLIVAGAIEGDEARRSLLGLLQHGNELAEEWAVGRDDLDAQRALLRDPKTPADVVRKVAFDAFLTESAETAWDEAHEFLGVDAGADSSAQVRELVHLWSLTASADRRARVLDFMRDQAQLAQLELQWELSPASGAPDDELLAAPDADAS